MCEICEKVKTVDLFATPKAYEDCLKYIQALVDSEDFIFYSKDCDTDKVKGSNGCWINDVINHVIECVHCKQHFTCTIITHQGRGSFQKDRELIKIDSQ